MESLSRMVPAFPREGILTHARTSYPRASYRARDLGGLALGAVTLLAQAVLPVGWNSLANSGAIWATGTFAAGAVPRQRGRQSALAGTVALVVTIVGYNATAQVALNSPESLVYEALWLGIAFVAGPLFGLVGAWVSDARRACHSVTVALLGGVFLGEGVWDLAYIPNHVLPGLIPLAIGVAVPLLLGCSARSRIRGLLASAPAGRLCLAGYTVINGIPSVI